MQTPNVRVLASLVPVLFAACGGSAENSYAQLPDPPLVQAALHTVTLVSDNAALAEILRSQGYARVVFTSNYPASIPVEANLWDVPEPVAAKPTYYKAPSTRSPDVRLLVMPLAARGLTTDSRGEQDFFRNVLGVDVPHWPEKGTLPANARVQVFTYLIPSVLEANKRLRANGIPVIFDPVGITTAYLGDHRAMAIRAPDGTVVELVETAAQ